MRLGAERWLAGSSVFCQAWPPEFEPWWKERMDFCTVALCPSHKCYGVRAHTHTHTKQGPSIMRIGACPRNRRHWQMWFPAGKLAPTHSSVPREAEQELLLILLALPWTWFYSWTQSKRQIILLLPCGIRMLSSVAPLVFSLSPFLYQSPLFPW